MVQGNQNCRFKFPTHQPNPILQQNVAHYNSHERVRTFSRRRIHVEPIVIDIVYNKSQLPQKKFETSANKNLKENSSISNTNTQLKHQNNDQ